MKIRNNNDWNYFQNRTKSGFFVGLAIINQYCTVSARQTIYK